MNYKIFKLSSCGIVISQIRYSLIHVHYKSLVFSTFSNTNSNRYSLKKLIGYFAVFQLKQQKSFKSTVLSIILGKPASNLDILFLIQLIHLFHKTFFSNTRQEEILTGLRVKLLLLLEFLYYFKSLFESQSLMLYDIFYRLFASAAKLTREKTECENVMFISNNYACISFTFMYIYVYLCISIIYVIINF